MHRVHCCYPEPIEISRLREAVWPRRLFTRTEKRDISLLLDAGREQSVAVLTTAGRRVLHGELAVDAIREAGRTHVLAAALPKLPQRAVLKLRKAFGIVEATAEWRDDRIGHLLTHFASARLALDETPDRRPVDPQFEKNEVSRHQSPQLVFVDPNYRLIPAELYEIAIHMLSAQGFYRARD